MEIKEPKNKKCKRCGAKKDYLQKVSGRLYYATYCSKCKPLISALYYYNNQMRYAEVAREWYHMIGIHLDKSIK